MHYSGDKISHKSGLERFSTCGAYEMRKNPKALLRVYGCEHANARATVYAVLQIIKYDRPAHARTHTELHYTIYPSWVLVKQVLLFGRTYNIICADDDAVPPYVPVRLLPRVYYGVKENTAADQSV